MRSNRANTSVKASGLERSLQLNVAALTALGALLLGTGQMGVQNVVLSLLTVLAAVTSAVFTDMLAWFRLNRTLANLVAILAVGFSLTDFFGNEAEYQLLAVANLLIYLQIVLLYQKKNERIYWQLLILSLLQVVVSAALNLGFQFGILIVIYMFAAFSAMTLFFFYRESMRFIAPVSGSGSPTAALGPAKRTARRHQHSGRWPLRPANRSLAFRFTGNLAEVLANRRLAQQVVSMGLSTLVFTVVFFFALPRASDSVWRGPRGLAHRVTGFSEEVTLGMMSELLQSDEEVLQVRYVDQETNEPMRIRTGPYIRGTVLQQYLYGMGSWSQITRSYQRRGEPLIQLDSREGVVRQDFLLQGRPNPVLFATFPVYYVPQSRVRVKIDLETRQLLHNENEGSPREPYVYVLGTTAFQDGQQLAVHPAGREYRDTSYEMDRMSRLRNDLLPRLTRTARTAIASAGVADDDAYGKALALEAHFQEPGLYNYSLSQVGVEHRRHLDPVEDFVANHRTGHCEYFASALVLMLRSQRIPARVVVGYRAISYDSEGEYYQVREKDAHAWVEVFLRDDQLPRDLREQARITPRGAWLRLDPTPVTVETDEEDEVATVWDSALKWKNYTRGLWSDYVLGLNARRQREAIYGPLRQHLSAIAKALSDERAWGNLYAKIAPVRWVIALAGVVVLPALVTFLWRRRRHRRPEQPRRSSLAARLAGWWRRGGRLVPERRRVRVDFYDRLETLLARHGMRRPGHQTQREFASAVGQLTEVPQRGRAASLAARIVNAFYLVRFGRRSLSAAQSQVVEDALSELRQTLSSDTKDGPREHSDKPVGK